MSSRKKIKVLVAENSATDLRLITSVLGSDPDIAVVGIARTGTEAVHLTKTLRPDVITMDIEMPEMDGYEATGRIMADIPTPIVMISGHYEKSKVAMSMQALSRGALHLLPKPCSPNSANFEKDCQNYTRVIKALAEVNLVKHRDVSRRTGTTSSVTFLTGARKDFRVIAVGASTGGPKALLSVLSPLPSDFRVPILVVQHMNAGFTEGLAEWLDSNCRLRVKVAVDGEALYGGTVYLAPDEYHFGISPEESVLLSKEPLLGGFRPSATFLFRSVAQVFGARTLATILTGMGDDGLLGLKEVWKAKGTIIAQDESTSVVFGMPRAAIEAKITERVLPLDEISDYLMERIYGSEHELNTAFSSRGR